MNISWWVNRGKAWLGAAQKVTSCHVYWSCWALVCSAWCPEAWDMLWNGNMVWNGMVCPYDSGYFGWLKLQVRHCACFVNALNALYIEACRPFGLIISIWSWQHSLQHSQVRCNCCTEAWCSFAHFIWPFIAPALVAMRVPSNNTHAACSWAMSDTVASL